MDIMSVAAYSMQKSQADMAQSLTIGMMKKSMEAAEDTAQGFLKMLDSMPSPDGRGLLFSGRF